MENYAKHYCKKGVLLVNLGSPEAPEKKAVKRYLKEFLSDRRVIEANPIVWWLILNGIILPIRSPKTAKLYQKIWFNKENASPLIYYTKHQAALLQQQVDDNVVVDYAMRYGKPAISDTIQSLCQAGVTELVVLPLYPQYSATTVASVYDEVFRVLQNFRWQPNLISVKPYYDHPAYINVLADSIKSHLNMLSFKPDVILTSFHGIPKAYFDKGDPYYCHCHKTYRLLKEKLQQSLDIQVDLAFQSRFGPKAWLQPYTSDKLSEYAASDKKNVVAIAPGFPSDCLETLEEIQQQERENFLKQGGQHFSFVPCLNDAPEHIDMLLQVVKPYLSLS